MDKVYLKYDDNRPYVECDYGIITPSMTATDNENAISSLADAIVYLANDEELLKKYSQLSKQRSLEYSPEVAAQKFRKIFDKLVDG